MRLFTHTVGTRGASLTCYIQEPDEGLKNATVRPAALILPGGAYMFLSAAESEPVALAYAAEGYNTFVLRYTVGPDSPVAAAYEDGQAALGWLRANATDLHIDPAKIVAVGFSAGGHLAASLGAFGPERPNALVLAYPGVEGPTARAGVSLADAITPEMPPAFLFGTVGDDVVPARQWLSLLQALESNIVPFESHLYMLGPHGVSLAKAHTSNGRAAGVSPDTARWFTDSVRFLTAIFGDFLVSGEPQDYSQLAARATYGPDMPIYRLIEEAGPAAVLEVHIPALLERLRGSAGSAMSLRQLSEFAPDHLPTATVERISADLARFNEVTA
ncbi:alpha/beta hydrolase [Microbacterium rhizosphaerae]|uniref:Alpha/beta hydrolase n=1 Tax=Microbacterium rhizosphaerae TaxID=1678237 RepID=A0ABZ0SKL1_9MICO|nr:alpha/beta hydrolase [Microbacterium rhizosphaerae]WPR89365.1 alpha/beta hydrolase [Microbacterium rhizosphaerae]